MHIVKLQLIGGNLLAAIPRALARELGWTHRMLVAIRRGEDNSATITNLEAHLANAKHLQTARRLDNPRTESPTAREHRTGGARRAR